MSSSRAHSQRPWIQRSRCIVCCREQPAPFSISAPRGADHQGFAHGRLFAGGRRSGPCRRRRQRRRSSRCIARYGKPVLPPRTRERTRKACWTPRGRGSSRAERLTRRVLLPFIDPSSGRDETLSRALGASTCKTHEIFVSYHRNDTGPDAARRLRPDGAYGPSRVFIDYLSFAPAQHLAQLVAKAGEAKLLIAFLGRTWSTRVSDEADYVRRETLAALAGGARVVPLFVDRGALTESEVPEALKQLPQINGIHFDRLRWEATMEDLESVIDGALGITRMT